MLQKRCKYLVNVTVILHYRIHLLYLLTVYYIHVFILGNVSTGSMELGKPWWLIA